MIVTTCSIGDLLDELNIYIFFKILVLRRDRRGQLDSLKLAFYDSVI